MKNTLLISTLTLILASASQAAITINIQTADSSSTLASIAINGSLTLNAANETQNRQSIVLTLSNGYQALGQNNIPIAGDWAIGGTTSGSSNFISPTAISYSYNDISNSNTALFSGFITHIAVNSTDLFTLDIDTAQLFDLSIESGDELVIQGQSGLQLDSAFNSTFNEGTYTGSYNGEDITLNISTVPEPSTTLFGAIAMGLILRRRHRTN